jgi:hypothetical protein
MYGEALSESAPKRWGLIKSLSLICLGGAGGGGHSCPEKRSFHSL